jgi:hypothetical protein
MLLSMTLFTDWDYIKPMLSIISIMMVIIRGLRSTLTEQGSNARHPACPDLVSNSKPGLIFQFSFRGSPATLVNLLSDFFALRSTLVLFIVGQFFRFYILRMSPVVDSLLNFFSLTIDPYTLIKPRLLPINCRRFPVALFTIITMTVCAALVFIKSIWEWFVGFTPIAVFSLFRHLALSFEYKKPSKRNLVARVPTLNNQCNHHEGNDNYNLVFFLRQLKTLVGKGWHLELYPRTDVLSRLPLEGRFT